MQVARRSVRCLLFCFAVNLIASLLANHVGCPKSSNMVEVLHQAGNRCTCAPCTQRKSAFSIAKAGAFVPSRLMRNCVLSMLRAQFELSKTSHLPSPFTPTATDRIFFCFLAFDCRCTDLFCLIEFSLRFQVCVQSGLPEIVPWHRSLFSV